MASRPDVDGLNAGYAALVLEQYLDNPGSVPEEWRALFETSDPAELLAMQPGLARLLERLEPAGNGHEPTVVAPVPVAAAPAPAPEAPVAFDEELFGGVAAAMALV